MKTLKLRESDNTENIRRRFDDYEVGFELYRDLAHEFGGFMVNADQDPDTIFEIIESKLDKPLPTTFPGK